ncbi:hypothetical protein HDU93_008964 [Gonapodya sp. JEL0774]|nr:hypothetical protein HDU93_008964 [Gonapodya sp. JEL0774]
MSEDSQVFSSFPTKLAARFLPKGITDSHASSTEKEFLDTETSFESLRLGLRRKKRKMEQKTAASRTSTDTIVQPHRPDDAISDSEAHEQELDGYDQDDSAHDNESLASNESQDDETVTKTGKLGATSAIDFHRNQFAELANATLQAKIAAVRSGTLDTFQESLDLSEHSSDFGKISEPLVQLILRAPKGDVGSTLDNSCFVSTQLKARVLDTVRSNIQKSTLSNNDSIMKHPHDHCSQAIADTQIFTTPFLCRIAQNVLAYRDVLMAPREFEASDKEDQLQSLFALHAINHVLK